MMCCAILDNRQIQLRHLHPVKDLSTNFKKEKHQRSASHRAQSCQSVVLWSPLIPQQVSLLPPMAFRLRVSQSRVQIPSAQLQGFSHLPSSSTSIPLGRTKGPLGPSHGATGTTDIQFAKRSAQGPAVLN